MNPLDKGENPHEIKLKPNDGERTLLSSNKGDFRSPSLDFNPNSPLISEELLVDQLAAILVQGFLERKRRDK